ncbi:Modifier of mdg4 [Lucilia cuprina]|nr:Modifier of mdg4 [Lucilia cuprina]
MDDEFKLCWKNFQDNIASGFQSLYDRGDLVDVTLACDGKLLQAHKIIKRTEITASDDKDTNIM